MALIVLSDGSSLANSGHLVSMINVMYDPAVDSTNQEYKDTTGKHVTVQAEVKKPCLYILARCRSNDEQLSYTHTRVDCMRELKYGLQTAQGHEILDKMKFGKAGGPIVQFETGNQKGGNYFCRCGFHADKVDELDHAFRCPYWSLEKRRLLVMAGPIGQTNSLKQKL